MAVFAVYIEKETEYHGAMRVFGNTYHFKPPTGVPFDDALAAQNVHDAEKAITDNSVNFTRWTTWGPTDGAEVDNVMREAGEFADSGSVAAAESAYKEVCSLVVWPLPRSVPLNRRRWLRKYMRMAFSGAPLDPVLAGSDPLSESFRQNIVANYADPITALGVGDDIVLCTAEGVEPNAPPEVRPYLITRQIGS